MVTIKVNKQTMKIFWTNSKFQLHHFLTSFLITPASDLKTHPAYEQHPFLPICGEFSCPLVTFHLF